MSERHFLIVGGTRGIGRAVAGHFLRQGETRVSLIGRSAPKPDDKILAGAWGLQVDLAQAEALGPAIERCVKERGRITDLVFCQRHRGDGQHWREMAEVSWGAVEKILGNGGEWLGKDGGSVVMISSPAAESVVGEQPPSYHIAKAGLEQLVRYFAVTLGPKGFRVNGVSPALVIKEESRAYFAQQTEMVGALERAMPLGSIPTAEEVADVIAFLCGPAARTVTGQIFRLDGGLSLRAPASLVLEKR